MEVEGVKFRSTRKKGLAFGVAREEKEGEKPFG